MEARTVSKTDRAARKRALTSGLRDDRRRDTAAVGADRPRWAQHRIDSAWTTGHRSRGAHGRGRATRAAGAAAAAAGAVDDACLAGVATHLALIAVVDHDLEPVRVTCRKRHLEAGLRPETEVG